MFKKKSYNIPKGGEEEYLERGRSHSEDEDEDAASDISEQSDDSLSTKSSRYSLNQKTVNMEQSFRVTHSRARSSSRRRSSGRQEENEVKYEISWS